MKRLFSFIAVGMVLLAVPRSSQVVMASTPVRHVVVLYLENHSFDNVLGAWCAQTGHCDGMPARVTLKGGVVVTPGTAPDIVPTVDHSVAAQSTAIDGGRMDGWAGVTGCAASTAYACISSYQPSQIPNEIALATHFAISDRTFSMADSPSWGGHLYAAAATTDGFTGDTPLHMKGAPPAGPGWGCDSNDDSPWLNPSTGKLVQEPSCIPDPALSLANGGAYRSTPVPMIPTIMDRLAAAGLTWRIYAATTSQTLAYRWAVCPTFAECLDTTQKTNMVPTAQILTDAAKGRLPSYALITPGGPYAGASQHNGHSMAVGDNWIGKVVTALEKGPEWGSTTLFITYDDCGCFYDHVAPGINPDGTLQGIRIPLVIVSPYAIAGYVDHTRTTFSGILAYVEKVFGLAPLSANDRAAYAFGNAFNYAQPPRSPVAMYQAPVSAASAAASANTAVDNDVT